MNPDFLTAKEVQTILRLGRNGVYDLARRREIQYVRIGSKIFFPRAAVEEFIRANTVSPKRNFFSMNHRGPRNYKPRHEPAESHKDDELHSSLPESSLRKS